jgi:hypothetical protein
MDSCFAVLSGSGYRTYAHFVWETTSRFPDYIVPKRTHAKISHLVASQQVVFALLVPSCQQVWNKLLTICNNLVNIVRLVTRLFQQVRYSHDITILLQPCVISLVTFLFTMTVSDLLEQPCNKSDNAIKLVTSC